MINIFSDKKCERKEDTQNYLINLPKRVEERCDKNTRFQKKENSQRNSKFYSNKHYLSHFRFKRNKFYVKLQKKIFAYPMSF